MISSLEKFFVLVLIPLLGLLVSCSTVTVTRMNDFHVQKDQVFKTVAQVSLKGDWYIPNLPGAKPAVVVVHGGGWDSRSGDMHEICEGLAGSGFVVFNTTYRLAPESLYPKSVEDVRDAFLFVKNHASEFEIDPKQISGWGYSAGAHLVLLVGLDPKLGLHSMVAGGTPADFSAWPYSPIITKYIGKTYAEAKDVWQGASPVNHVSENSPPVFLYHGHNDHLVEVDQMYKMRDALQKKNVEVQTHEVAFLGHIFTYLFSTESIREGVAFLQTHRSER